MDFAGFYEAVEELMPRDFQHHAKVLNYLEEVEYNVRYLAPEIYKPKEEIKSYLGEMAGPEEPWVQSVLERLDQA